MIPRPRYIRLIGDVNPLLRGRVLLVVSWDSDSFAVCYFNKNWGYRYAEQGVAWELAEEP